VPEDTPVDDSSAAATKLSISRIVNAFFANKNMSRRTCACCNELFSPSKMKSVKSAGDWLLRLRNRLSWAFTTHELTDETRRFYDVSEIEPALADVPLAKAGIVLEVITKKKVQVMTTALQEALKRLSRSDRLSRHLR
jgi:hypothetical protein